MLDQVVVAKRLFTEAQGYIDRDDSFHWGIAISLAQDSVELLLRAICNSKLTGASAASITRATAFDGLLKAVESLNGVPAKPRLLELNTARVSFKHYGQPPTRDTARRAINAGEDFLREACASYFEVDFAHLSMVDIIQNAEVRNRLKAAEQHARREEYSEAVVASAEALHILEDSVASLLPKPDRRLARLGDGIADRNASQRLNDAGNYMSSYFDRIQVVLLSALLRIDGRRLIRLQSFLPRMHRTPSGKFMVTHLRSEYELWHATEALKVAQELAIAMESAQAFAPDAPGQGPSIVPRRATKVGQSAFWVFCNVVRRKNPTRMSLRLGAEALL